MFQNSFHIKRFSNALQYDLRLNAKKYISFVASLFVILLLLNLFFIAQSGRRFNLDQYMTLFYFSFILGLVIVVGTSFPALRDKKSTINYLMIPASVFEKFLIQFVIRILCFMILFVPFFWLDFKVADGIYHLIYWTGQVEIQSFNLLDPIDIKYLKALDVLAILCALFSLAAFLFVGSVYFKKYALPKTVFSFALFAVFVFVIFVIDTSIFYPEKFSFRKNPIYINDYKLSKNLINIQLFFYVIGFFSSLFLLPMAYFKLKEKEI